MKYVLNTGRYAVAFTINKPNGDYTREVKIELDRRRVFTDTGNLATTGITAVEDEDFELLKKNKAFNRLFKEENGFKLISEAEAVGAPDKQTSELEEENKKLKEQLAEAKQAVKESKDAKAVEKIKAENAKLKEQLEALTKDKADDEKADAKADDEKADAKADDEGF